MWTIGFSFYLTPSIFIFFDFLFMEEKDSLISCIIIAASPRSVAISCRILYYRVSS